MAGLKHDLAPDIPDDFGATNHPPEYEEGFKAGIGDALSVDDCPYCGPKYEMWQMGFSIGRHRIEAQVGQGLK